MKQRTRKRQAEMTILEHLNELRQRLMRAVIALLVGVVIGTFITRPVLQILLIPLGDLRPQAIKPTETISVYFQISIIIGLVLAMPFITYQIFQYAAPGLETREKRYILIGAPAASLSFAAGVFFAATVLLRNAIPFLTGILSDIIEQKPTIENYITFVGSVLLWVGVVFETPLIMFILAKLGVISHTGYIKAWRVVVIGAAVGAAIITPTVDPINMMLVMGPFLLLYGLGILLAWLVRPKAT
jgi:sec-independent protein translocase protein TatC